MAYTKRVWVDDDLITPEDMNRIENGIYNNDSVITGTCSRVMTGINEVKDSLAESESNVITRIDNLSSDNENSFSEVMTNINDKSDSLNDKLNSISSKIDAMNNGEIDSASSEFQSRVETSVNEMKSTATIINDRLQEIEDETTRVKDKMDSALAQMGVIPEINANVSDIDNKYTSITESQSEILSATGLNTEKIEETKSKIDDIISNVASILEKLNTPPEEMPQDLQGSLETISNKVTNVGGGLSTVKSLCDEIKTGITSVGTSIENINVPDTSPQLVGLEVSISSLTEIVSSLSSSILALDGKLNVLSNRVYSIWESSLESIDPSTFTTYNDSTKNVLINTNTPLTSITNINAKSIEIENLSMQSTRVSLTAENSVNISNFNSSGNLSKAVSNAAMSINTNDNVSIVNSNIAQTGYNSIEIGLSNTAPKSVTIQNVNFNQPLSNNAILIFAHQPNSEIVIKDCYFKEVSNVLRISNRTNVPATIYLTNCKIDKWDSDLGWAGAIIFEDYTSANAQACQENDLFNKDKLKIFVTNVYGPDGNKITAADMTRTDAQGHFAYIWNNNEGFVNFVDSPDRYPTFVFA